MKKEPLFILFFFIFSYSVFAQQVDSVRFDTSVVDTILINNINEHAITIREKNPTLSLRYNKVSLEYSENLKYAKGKAKALANMAWVHYRNSNWQFALELAVEASSIAEEIGALEEMFQSGVTIASVYNTQRRYSKSIAQLKRMLEIAIRLNNEAYGSRIHSNLAFNYLFSNSQLDSVAYHSELGLSIAKKINDPYLIAYALRNTGELKFRNKDYNGAISDLSESISLAQKIESHALVSQSSRRLSEVYGAQKNHTKAYEFLNLSTIAAKKNGNLYELSLSYKLLAEYFKSTGNLELAYVHLMGYTDLRDSIGNLSSSNQIVFLQDQYETKLLNSKIKLLTKETELNTEIINNQRKEFNYLILFTILIILLFAVIITSYLKGKKVRTILENQQQALTSQNLAVSEKNKELEKLNRIKTKLFSIIGHDFRSPLQSLKGALSIVDKGLSKEELNKILNDLRTKLDVVYDNLDNLLKWSASQMLQVQTLKSKVSVKTISNDLIELYRDVAEQKKIVLSNMVPDYINVLADEDQVRLILRNLISNAIKFTSKQGQVEISASTKKSRVFIIVSDTGIGIDSDRITTLLQNKPLESTHGTGKEKGLGLGLMLSKEFIEKNGGKLQIESTLGKGSKFTFDLETASE